MTTTTSILDSITAEAAAFRAAQGRYDKAFRMFRITTPPLSPEHFWPMADAFRLQVLRAMQYRTERVVDAAADEFMRQAVVGQSPYDLAAAVHFAVSYDDYKRKSHSGGDQCKFSFDRGGDGYGDLMDAVVLLGREFNERLHAGRFHDLAEFSDAVMDCCERSIDPQVFTYEYSDDPGGRRQDLANRFCKLILRGENYCGMSLSDEAKRWLPITAKDGEEVCDDAE